MMYVFVFWCKIKSLLHHEQYLKIGNLLLKNVIRWFVTLPNQQFWSVLSKLSLLGPNLVNSSFIIMGSLNPFPLKISDVPNYGSCSSLLMHNTQFQFARTNIMLYHTAVRPNN